MRGGGKFFVETGGGLSVAGEGDFVGGLVGYSQGTISNCYATGALTANCMRLGGLVGSRLGQAGMSNDLRQITLVLRRVEPERLDLHLSRARDLRGEALAFVEGLIASGMIKA